MSRSLAQIVSPQPPGALALGLSTNHAGRKQWLAYIDLIQGTPLTLFVQTLSLICTTSTAMLIEDLSKNSSISFPFDGTAYSPHYFLGHTRSKWHLVTQKAGNLATKIPRE
jgi:hypothetical protein